MSQRHLIAASVLGQLLFGLIEQLVSIIEAISGSAGQFACEHLIDCETENWLTVDIDLDLFLDIIKEV